VHTLLHLADAVRNLGPLWAHSTFPFEEMNGWLGELYHGIREPQKQVCTYIYEIIIFTITVKIVKAVTERQRLGVANEEMLTDNEDERITEFTSCMLNKSQRYT